tara:strand:- start:1077 stop:1346 length:270 start_codon:yes stop_codon:yes gene_type:complete
MGAPLTGKSSGRKKESMAVTNTSTVEKLDSSNPRKEGATIADAGTTDIPVLTAAQIGKFLSSKISPTSLLMVVLIYMVASPDLSGMCLP